MKSTGQKIAELRSTKKMTQEDLAESLGVSRQTIYKWEADLVMPTKDNLKAIVKLFDTSFNYLLGDDEEVKEEINEEVNEEINEELKEEAVEKSKEEVKEEEPIKKEKLWEEPKQTEEKSWGNPIIKSDVCIGTCYDCGRKIYEGEYFENQVVHISHGRRSERKDVIVCEDCAESRRKKAEAIHQEEVYEGVKKRIWSLILGVIAGVATGLILGLWCDLGAGLSVICGIAMFTFIGCLILANNFVGDMFETISSWSIHFPGLIFSFDIDGFIWAIAMKILFAIIGVIIGILAFIAALVLSAAMSLLVYPFAIIKNIKDPSDFD